MLEHFDKIQKVDRLLEDEVIERDLSLGLINKSMKREAIKYLHDAGLLKGDNTQFTISFKGEDKEDADLTELLVEFHRKELKKLSI